MAKENEEQGRGEKEVVHTFDGEREGVVEHVLHLGGRGGDALIRVSVGEVGVSEVECKS